MSYISQTGQKNKVWTHWFDKANPTCNDDTKIYSDVRDFCENLDGLVFNNSEFDNRIGLIDRLLSKKEVTIFFWFLVWNYYIKYISFDSSDKLNIGEKEIELFINYAEQMIWAVENVLLGKKYPVDKAINLSRIDKIPHFLMKSIRNLNRSLYIPFWHVEKQDNQKEIKRKELYQSEDKFFWENLFRMILMYYSNIVEEYSINNTIKQFISSDNKSLNDSFGYMESVYKQHEPIYRLIKKYFDRAKVIGIKHYCENMLFLDEIDEIDEIWNKTWNISLMTKKIRKPIHIGLIMDGNRRFDREFGLCSRYHFLGALNCINILSYLVQLRNVTEITFYTLSADNLAKRSDEEKNDLFWVFNYFIDKIITIIGKVNDKMIKQINNLLDKDHTRIYPLLFLNFIGEIEKLPTDEYQKLVKLEKQINETNKDIIEKLIENKLIDSSNQIRHRYINFAIVYDGQREIELATQNMVKKAIKKKKLGKKFKGNLEDFLWLKSKIDLVIRTGDVVRTSSFFPYQTIYSEWFFRTEMWPQLNEYDIQKILDEYYTKRQRRFGK